MFRTLAGAPEILPNGFRHKGVVYPFTAILHLERYSQRTYNIVQPWGDYQSFLRVRVYLAGSRKCITLTNRFVWSSRTALLQGLYEGLAERTYHQRFAHYLSQVEQSGSFEYAKATFYSTGHVATRNRRINLREAVLSWEPFDLIVKEKPKLLSRKVRISTLIDQDVFLGLVKRLYGVSIAGIA